MRPARSFVWPAGEHDFCLGIGELRALEQRSDAGCFVILTRLLTSQWKIDDVLQPIRLGLIGGGMDEREAQRTIDRALEIASPYSLAVPAATILHSFLMWDEEADQPGGVKGGDGKSSAPLPNGKTRWSQFYMTGAALGLSPRQIDDMTLWEFNCCATGFAKANGAEDKAPDYSDEVLSELGIAGFE